jgi:uncharacterized repeat protein (TIGR03803 family)
VPLLAVVFASIMMAAAAQAQSFNLLYTFGAGAPGQYPYGTLVEDGRGNLYGTTPAGGTYGGGIVFELSRRGSGWIITPLYDFYSPLQGDAAVPYSGVVFGPDGSLYGTTYLGGTGPCSGYCGTVYNLRPPAHACTAALCSWTETDLYHFAGGTDGAYPAYGSVTFDAAGNLYGTTSAGGAYGNGTVYKLTHSQGGWTESVLYSFAGGSDGSEPYGSVIFDEAGNLYGTTSEGGGSGCYHGLGVAPPLPNLYVGCGTVFQLTPSGSGWRETILYTFRSGTDGAYPYGGLVEDGAGNLYGSTTAGSGGSGSGTVFELSPSGGGWAFTTLSGLPGGSPGPLNSLTLDAGGNLYGTAYHGGGGPGSVFELQRGSGGWTYVDLHYFNGEPDGESPIGSPLVDSNGNVFGTASTDGGDGSGTVWEITP